MKKVYSALGEDGLNFLQRQFFTYWARVAKSIDNISSKLLWLQLITRDIKELQAPTDLDVILPLINSVDNESYSMAKYYREDMRNLSLIYIKERFKLVEQKIQDKTNAEMQTTNKASAKGKKKPLCFYYDKLVFIKVK